MPDYAYVARDNRGKRLTGTLSAATQREAIAQLDAKSLFPVELKQTKSAADPRNRRVSGQVMANAYTQLASLLRSGVPLLRSITVMSNQASKPALKAVLDEIKARVEEGEPLPAAMARFPRVFSDMAINMVRAGTEGGFLEDALERVAAFTEQQEELKGRAIGALAYPIFLGVVGSSVVTVLVVFFVPNFETLFANMREKGTLPWATDALLNLSAFLQSYWFVPIGLIVAAVAGVNYYLRRDDGKQFFDWFKIKMPMFGSIF